MTGDERPEATRSRAPRRDRPKAVDGQAAPRGRDPRPERFAGLYEKDGYYGNDPSAGSPTETLLRLHLPLNSEV